MAGLNEQIATLARMRASLQSAGYAVCNISPLSSHRFAEFCQHFGKPREVYSGANSIHVEPIPGSPHRSLTRRHVPFHNEAAYLARPPRLIAFYCHVAPQAGGETILARGDVAAKTLDERTFETLSRLQVSAQLGEHRASRPLIIRHPARNVQVLFYMDPLVSRDAALVANGSPLPHPMLRKVRAALRGRAIVTSHRWATGDLLLIDNFFVLHSRNAFSGSRRIERMLID